jgi:hypothetical protein
MTALKLKETKVRSLLDNDESQNAAEQTGPEIPTPMDAAVDKLQSAKVANGTDTKRKSSFLKLLNVKLDKAKTKSNHAKHTPAASAPVKSKRSLSFEATKMPFPTAPITRLRKTKASRPSPLDLIRARMDGQLVPDPKFHPADPLNSFLRFPGSAKREDVEIKANSADETIFDEDKTTWSEDIVMTPIQPKEFRPIPTLEHGLDRVLFKYAFPVLH